MIKILILGGNFAGSTAALEIRRRLKHRKDVEVTVVSPAERFLYVPSLIWVPFGKRKVEDISFPAKPMFEKKGVQFIHDAAVRIDPKTKIIETEKNGNIHYDYLVIATGISQNFDAVQGLNQGYVHNIVTPPGAERAWKGFQEFVQNPGPVIVGATQGASCMGAAYEYLFNFEREARRHKVRKKVDLTWITPEPFLGHFGIGGIIGGEKMLHAFMKMFNIKWYTNMTMKEIQKDNIVLGNDTVLPYKMSMIMPPFIGAKVVRESPGIGDDKGFVPTNDGYQHLRFPDIYSAGLAVEVKSPFTKCAAPFGVPKTGFPSDVQGKTVAKNITAQIEGTNRFYQIPFGKIPGICIMDAGEKEVLILTNHLFKPRSFELMIPNVIFNFGKILLEKYMLFKNRRGLSFLP